MFERVFFIVLDSVGVGAMPDAAHFGDALTVNTIGHAAASVNGVKLPHLEKMGIGNITAIAGVPAVTRATAAHGKCAETSNGKDTTTGHWEMAGLLTQKPFPTFFDGFPPQFMERFVREAKISGFLGNIAASGTEIIEQLGLEHIKSGKPIIYTSSDSVFQIACNEESFGLDRLYQICEIARKICDDYKIARVIARPFIGDKPGSFKRTGNRKDYSIELSGEIAMQKILRAGLSCTSIGKVASIYSEQGFDRKVKASNNAAIFDAIVAEATRPFKGLVFANLVDFDMLYGHRRNPQGYAKELEWFDSQLPRLLEKLGPKDLLLLSADHGNDPTAPGSDHTREYVPILAYSQRTQQSGGADLGIRQSFADIGQTILEALGVPEKQSIGTSFCALL